jgi:excisionase family DNA binding protein
MISQHQQDQVTDSPVFGAGGIEQRLLSVAQAAREVGCSTDTIRRAYACGELRVMRVGSRIRIRSSDLSDWIDRGGRTR